MIFTDHRFVRLQSWLTIDMLFREVIKQERTLQLSARLTDTRYSAIECV